MQVTSISRYRYQTKQIFSIDTYYSSCQSRKLLLLYFVNSCFIELNNNQRNKPPKCQFIFARTFLVAGYSTIDVASCSLSRCPESRVQYELCDNRHEKGRKLKISRQNIHIDMKLLFRSFALSIHMRAFDNFVGMESIQVTMYLFSFLFW